ncbi:hypothetical protein [Streptomyces curacoi]|uniref:hypothetical protein n=1 Tax=Streptomyces curacoi TaxID=146536 RepID=UPI00131C30AB
MLPARNGRRVLAGVVLGEAGRLLSAPLEGTAACVQNRARLVQALDGRLTALHRPVRRSSDPVAP